MPGFDRRDDSVERRIVSRFGLMAFWTLDKVAGEFGFDLMVTLVHQSI